MANLINKSGGWSAVRRELGALEKPALLALLKDLYGIAGVNRDFMLARTTADVCGGAAIEKYRARIINQFFPARGYGKLKLGEARRAIRDYGKAAGDIPGTLELLMTYVENGAKYTHDFGDIDQRFYTSVEEALDELSAILLGEARELYPRFRDRLAETAWLADSVGWGFCDFVAEVVQDLEEELGGGNAAAQPHGKQVNNEK